MSERFSSLSRIIGGSELDKQIAAEHARETFESQENLKGEREKTPEELIMIQLANEATNALLVKYGLEPFDVPVENIHVIQRGEWGDETADGMFKSGQLYIVVKEQSSLSVFTDSVTHEMIHFKALNVWKLSKTPAGNFLHIRRETYPEGELVTEFHTSDYRSGMDVRKTKEKGFFGALNEAMTERMTKDLMIAWRNNPSFASEWSQTKTLMEGSKMHPDNVISVEKTVEGKKMNLFAYFRERRTLNRLIKKIFDRNPGQFKDKDEVFDGFARFYFTGKSGTFLQVIDKTFGAGTLRKIAECDKDIDTLEKFVEDL